MTCSGSGAFEREAGVVAVEGPHVDWDRGGADVEHKPVDTLIE